MCVAFAVIWLLFLVGIALAIAEGRNEVRLSEDSR